jgi:uncharacterized protein (TIGR04255 family)
MKEFPDSALVYRRQLLIADIGPETKLENLPAEHDTESRRKIWQFKSGKGVVLNVLSDSLDIASSYHKTYNLPGGDKFRDAIKFIVDSFLGTTQIPVITRIGLRYIDECPIPAKDNASFSSYYNTSFPLGRFDIATASEMDFKAVIKKDHHSLRYVESLKKIGNEYKLVLDFDGFATNIASSDYLTITDTLHTIISDEFEASIKEPVFRHMREQKEFKIIVIPFGRYNIGMRLSENNEFRGIESVEVNKDFLTYKQRVTPKGFHDVNEFYKE